MQRADGADVKGGCLFQKRLHLGAEFADDAEIIPPRFAVPLVILRIIRPELAEGVGGKQHAVFDVVGKRDFRPVHHRGSDKLQRVRAELQRVAFFDDQPAVFVSISVKVLHHIKRLSGCRDNSLWIFLHKTGNIGRMIRLHMMDNEIISRPPAKSIFHFAEPFSPETCLNRVAHRRFLIQNHIRIIRHPFRHNILPLKQVYVVIIHADIKNIF